jgi:hypothetical protein
MPGERAPEPESLDNYLLAGKSLHQWRGWLTVNHTTGANESHKRTPGSRYGRTSDECAWYVLAATVAYTESADYPNSFSAVEITMDTCQSLAVNDSPEVAEMIVDSWHVIPECLRAMIGDEEDVKGLL